MKQINNNNDLTKVTYAPFLLWNEHNDKYFQKLGQDNKIAIDTNEIQNCNINENSNLILLMKEAFYLKENINYLQNKIIENVYIKSDKKYILKPQKYELMIQLMNNFWNGYCRYLPYDFDKQIEELNNKIIDFASDKLLKETNIYLNYIRDSNVNNNILIPPPENVSSKRTYNKSIINLK